MTSQAALDNGVGLTLQQRVLRHKSFWPYSRMNLCQLRRIYREHGIKEKVIQVKKVQPP